MGSLFGGLGGSPNTYSTGGSSRAYIPTGLGSADMYLQNLLGFGSGQGGGFSSAAGSVPQDNPNYTAYQTGLGLYGQAAPLADQYLINPGTASQYQYGAQTAADYFNNKVSPYYTSMPGTFAGYSNALGTLAPQLQSQIAGAATPLQGYSSTILNTAFDPQNSLNTRNQGQIMNQSAAANAMAGLGGTGGYAPSVTSNALGNYDIDWQNAQLNRQATGLGAAGQNQQTIGSLLGQSGTTAANLYGAAGTAANTGLGLGNNLVQGTNYANSLPFLAGTNIGKTGLDAITGLNSLIGGVGQTGASSFNLGQMSIQDLLSYLSAGNQATQTSGNLGQQGYNQGLSSLLGLGSLAGLGISTGGFGLGGLLGGGSAALPAANLAGVGGNSLSFYDPYLGYY